MKTYQQPLTGVADRVASRLFGFKDYAKDDSDPDFQDFCDGISLSNEELAVFIATPEMSVPEVKRLFAERQPRRR